MNASFWRGKKVFITGHTGFKGSWLSLLLNKLGAKICGYSLPPPTDPNLFTLARINSFVESVEGDVRNLSILKKITGKFQPDIIFHLAAQSLVRESYRDPVYTYETNVLGTVNLLESARDIDCVQSIIIVTSDKCYLNKNLDRGYREDDELGGQDPYSNSKACAELVTTAYRDSYFSSAEKNKTVPHLTSVRAGNVIGGGDWAKDRLIPDLIRGFISNQKTAIRNPNAIRPWQHVFDPLSGYLLLAEKLVSSPGHAGAWNFGPDFNDAKSVAWIADHLTKLWKEKDAGWQIDNRKHPEEAKVLKLDNHKAKIELGWRSKLNLETALEWTLDWYKKFSNNEPMLPFSEMQIDQYISLE